MGENGMHKKWTTPTPITRQEHPLTTNEQFNPTPVLKTIFEQLDKTSPDRRSLDERMLEKATSLVQRLTK